MSACKSCGASVIWVELPSGKRNPLDYHVSLAGNITILASTSPSGARMARVLTDNERAHHQGPLYISHFTTCPDAGTHRRPR